MKYIIGSSIAVIFIVIGFMSLDSNKLEYTDVNYARESRKRVQVQGVWVREKGADYDSHTNQFSFYLQDSEQSQIKVVHEGARPNNFELSESVVIKGRVESDVFHAESILTKCPSKYEGTAEELKGYSTL